MIFSLQSLVGLKRAFTNHLNIFIMPNNKRFSLRAKVLDGLLRKEGGVSMREILRIVNRVLAMYGISPVSKETISRDILALENGYHKVIVTSRDKRDKRIIRYRYEDSSFSIFNTPLTDREIKEIKGLFDVLSSINGFPQCDWMNELCARFDVATEINGHKVVQFEESCSKLGMEWFSKIFHTILRQKAASITYQRFGHKKRKHKVFPYYIKQHRGRWYLVGCCSSHPGSLSPFSLDRLLSFDEEPELEYVPIGIDIDEYYKDVVGITRPDNGTPITIRFQVNARELPYLTTSPIHHSQVVEEENEEGAILSIHVIPTPELLMWFLSLGDNVKILTECQLREDLVEKCNKIVRMYESST